MNKLSYGPVMVYFIIHNKNKLINITTGVNLMDMIKEASYAI